jgi:hypothetical protein
MARERPQVIVIRQGGDHGCHDPIVTGKIALAHLTEFPDYYSCLAVLEREAEEHLRSPG